MVSSRSGLPGIPLTGLLRCWTGWSRRRTSHHISPCSTSRSEMTVPSRAATFDMIRPATSTTAPAGKRLGTSGTVHGGKTLLYRASKLDCDACPLKPQCCPKEPSRKIPRNIHEHARDVARSFAGTEGFETSRRQRKKQEDRDAVCAFEAHPEAWSASASWPTGRPGRVCSCCNRSKSEAPRALGSADQSRSALPNGRKTSVGYSRLLRQNRPCPDIATGGAS